MSGNSTGNVLGASTTVAGIVALPNTGASMLHQVIAITIISLGILVLTSMAIRQLLARI